MAGRRRASGEGSVYYDESKNRWVGSLVVNGKRRKVLARTKTEARERLDALRAEVRGGGQVVNGNLRVSDVLDGWRSRTLAGKDVAASTRETYEWCIARLQESLGTRRLDRLTVEHVERALDDMAVGTDGHRPLRRSSLVKTRSVLAQALDGAVRRGQAPRNVARLAELPPHAVRAKERRSLTADEARRLLSAMEGERLRALYLLMLTVSLRPGEAAGLRWDDVDVNAGRVAIRSGVRIERGRPILVDELKTRRSRRTIDLPPLVRTALAEHKKAQRVERLAAKEWADESLVFASAHGTLLEPRTIRRTLERILVNAQLGELTPNELRHSAASLLSAAGVPLEHIADLLGHTNTRMLEQTYRHAVQPSLSAAVGPMEKLLSETAV